MHQSTDTIMMVEPADFSFNAETAVDNEFQNAPGEDALLIHERAKEEFHEAVALLRSKGIRVLVLAKPPGLPYMPDAVFPNNWLSTEPNGLVVVYPMAAPNRRAERLQLPFAEQLFLQNNLSVENVLQIGKTQEDQAFLEGTGSMVLDRKNRIVYGAISIRTAKSQLENFAKMLNYKQVVSFKTQSAKGKAFYHTNVVMSVCEGFSIVCLDCVPDPEERKNLRTALEKNGKVISISLDQAEKNFCANVLEVKNQIGDRFLVMSQSAFDGFTAAQKADIETFCKPLPIRIPTIEFVGGGSARCMMAEVFLHHKV